jgi:putative GTP pyrophosphokinase
MARLRTKQQRREFLTQRAIRFFNRYGDELDSIRQLVKIRLDQLALAYTLENDLPREAIEVRSRVKSLASFLNKLEGKNWPVFYYPTEVVTDLIGARVICWFLDDCYGMLEYMRASKQFRIARGSLEDYISNPKPTGYRSIHLTAHVPYDRVKTYRRQRMVTEDTMICEVQIRTKLQDAWGEFTHEMHYKVPERFEADYETVVTEIANRLAAEDKSALAVRNILQRESKKKEHEGFREG